MTAPIALDLEAIEMALSITNRLGPTYSTALIAEVRRLRELGILSAIDRRKLGEENAALEERVRVLTEALASAVKAWTYEASQGDGIMEEHAPALFAAQAALGGES